MQLFLKLRILENKKDEYLKIASMLKEQLVKEKRFCKYRKISIFS
ncbi:hypothetical protein [Aliarcobacter butzleri]|nr:hypothetical protein [Aliarcobacter butzleri]